MATTKNLYIGSGPAMETWRRAQAYADQEGCSLSVIATRALDLLLERQTAGPHTAGNDAPPVVSREEFDGLVARIDQLVDHLTGRIRKLEGRSDLSEPPW